MQLLSPTPTHSPQSTSTPAPDPHTTAPNPRLRVMMRPLTRPHSPHLSPLYPHSPRTHPAPHLQVDQRHGLTECAAERLASILTSSATPSQAELGGPEAAGDPDDTASFAAATHAAASFASAAHAAAALSGPTKAAPSTASPAEPRAPTASPDGARLGPEWERLAAAALAAAAIAQPVKAWSTPWRAPVLYSQAMAPIALAADATIDTATGGQP